MNQQQELEMALQLGSMWNTGREWLKTHPGADVKVQFNYPGNWHVIKPISNAVTQKLVSANADGMALMKSLWRWDLASEPSVTMMRVVLESLKDEQEPDLLGRVKRMIDDFHGKHKAIIQVEL